MNGDSHSKKAEKYRPSTSHPITSYGLILFYLDRSDPLVPIPKFLIYQRRDNYEYIDILRGNWNNEKRLKELFLALSPAEKKRIREYTFEELWDDLWVTKENAIHHDGFEKAKKRYELIKDKIHEYLDQGGLEFVNSEPPWGFPKGKKNDADRETDKECALREFGEETGLPTDEIVIWETNHYAEFYKGNNGKPYCTYYYVAESIKPFPVKRVSNPGCIRQDSVSDEAEDARWVTFEEACLKLSARKQMLLKKVLHLIETSYDKYSLLSNEPE
jgi:ADP-ribose pyrophosphatase YjhB (NUDIX family)